MRWMALIIKRTVTKLDMTASGNVDSAKPMSKGNAALDACVVLQLKRLKFAAKDSASFA